jgi:hypothetical protein
MASDPQEGEFRNLEEGEYKSILEEAVELRMIPYHGQAWYEYRFSGRKPELVALLLEVYYELLVVQKLDAIIILQWCRNGTFRREAMTRMRGALKAFIHNSSFSHRLTPFHNDERTRKEWLVQAKHCLQCDKLQKSVNDETALEK